MFFCSILFWGGSVAVGLSLLSAQASHGAEAVDKTLQPPSIETENINEVYRDIVVVQRKAKDKSGKWLLNTFGSFDFSDGPTTLYGLNVNPGYAFSDFWELYGNYVPAFVAQERDVVKRVEELVLKDGDVARIRYSKPKAQYGLELVWAPAYGKDSWGPYTIVRSDTFLKLAAGVIQYEDGTGFRTGLMIGKTFFLSNMFNVRLAAGGSILQSLIFDNASKSFEKKAYVVAILEAGLVWYF